MASQNLDIMIGKWILKYKAETICLIYTAALAANGSIVTAIGLDGTYVNVCVLGEVTGGATGGALNVAIQVYSNLMKIMRGNELDL